MDSSLIQLITDLVVAELGASKTDSSSGAVTPSSSVQLSCSGPPPGKRKVLLCAVPAPADGLAASWAALKSVEEVNWVVVSGCWRTPAPAVPLERAYLSEVPGVWEDFLSTVEAVVLPALTLEVLSKTALLIPDVPAVAAALHGLSLGIPVYANSFEPEKLRRSTGRLPGGFQSAYFQHLRTVESLGVQVLEASQIASRLGSKTRPLAASARGRDVLTVEDLDAFARSGSKQLRVAPGTIVTPLARDKAQSMGIEVIYS